MKKSELIRIIREELEQLNEGGFVHGWQFESITDVMNDIGTKQTLETMYNYLDNLSTTDPEDLVGDYTEEQVKNAGHNAKLIKKIINSIKGKNL